MTNQIGSGTAQGLIEYLDQLVEKGRASSGGIVPLKSTLKQVLSSVDGTDGWKATDIRNIDTEDYISRFKNLTIGKYSQSSYTVYLSRLNKIKSWYTTFLSNPGWVPQFKSPKKNGTKQNTVPGKSTSTQGRADEAKLPISLVEEIKPTQENNKQNDLISYPFPLRTGKMVYLYLPVDLTSVEAKRLGKYLESLSMDQGDQ